MLASFEAQSTCKVNSGMSSRVGEFMSIKRLGYPLKILVCKYCRGGYIVQKLQESVWWA
jgi:hypothetical protein